MINATQGFLIAGHFYLGGFKRNIRNRYSIHNLIVRDRSPDRKRFFRFLPRFLQKLSEALRLRSNQPEDLPQSTALQRYLPWPYEDPLPRETSEFPAAFRLLERPGLNPLERLLLPMLTH